MTEPLFADHHNARAVEMRCANNEFYARALETEDYREAVALRDRARQLQSTLPGVARPESPTGSDADPQAWLESLADAEIAEQIRAAKWQALNNLVLDCNRRISDASRDIARMCASLNVDLHALMNDVSAVVERLNGARTPNEVIATGIGDVWRELFPLRQSYDQIRQAQVGRDELQNARSKYVDDPHASDAWIANLDTVFPGWREPDRTFRLSGDAPRRQPWPPDDVEQLIWLHGSDAEPWIPTLAELDKLRAERHRRLNPMPKQQRRIGPGWTIPPGVFDDAAPESAAMKH